MEPFKLTEPHYMFCGTLVEEHCSGRSGTRGQYGVPKWYEILERCETPGLVHIQSL